MANLLASRKCAVLTSDSFKEALYLNEGCTHRSRARGEVQGSMRPLIKAEHPSPVFRMHLKSQRHRSLKLAESPVIKSCQVLLRPQRTGPPPDRLLGGGADQALAGGEAPPASSGLHLVRPGTHTVTAPKGTGGEFTQYPNAVENPDLARPKCRRGMENYCLNRLG